MMAVRRSLSTLRAASISWRNCLSSNSLLIEQSRLLAKTAFEILGAASENFRFLGLRHQLLLKLGDTAREILHPAAFFQQFLGAAFNSTRSASRRSSTVFNSWPAPSSRSLSASTCVFSAMISTFWESASVERSSSSLMSFVSSACLSDSARCASCMALDLTANSSSVARN